MEPIIHLRPEALEASLKKVVEFGGTARAERAGESRIKKHEKRAALVDAIGSVQMIALIMQALGGGETPVEPGGMKWLGKRLEEAYEAAASALADRAAEV